MHDNPNTLPVAMSSLQENLVHTESEMIADNMQ
jgi:hypothetical protein